MTVKPTIFSFWSWLPMCQLEWFDLNIISQDFGTFVRVIWLHLRYFGQVPYILLKKGLIILLSRHSSAYVVHASSDIQDAAPPISKTCREARIVSISSPAVEAVGHRDRVRITSFQSSLLPAYKVSLRSFKKQGIQKNPRDIYVTRPCRCSLWGSWLRDVRISECCVDFMCEFKPKLRIDSIWLPRRLRTRSSILGERVSA